MLKQPWRRFSTQTFKCCLAGGCFSSTFLLCQKKRYIDVQEVSAKTTFKLNQSHCSKNYQNSQSGIKTLDKPNRYSGDVTRFHESSNHVLLSSFQVVHLVRDPRGSIYSGKKLTDRDYDDLGYFARKLCSNLVEDLKLKYDLPEDR